MARRDGVHTPKSGDFATKSFLQKGLQHKHPRKTKMEPENTGLEKEKHLQTCHRKAKTRLQKHSGEICLFFTLFFMWEIFILYKHFGLFFPDFFWWIVFESARFNSFPSSKGFPTKKGLITTFEIKNKQDIWELLPPNDFRVLGKKILTHKSLCVWLKILPITIVVFVNLGHFIGGGFPDLQGLLEETSKIKGH